MKAQRWEWEENKEPVKVDSIESHGPTNSNQNSTGGAARSTERNMKHTKSDR